MDEEELKLKRKVKIIVTAAMSLFFVLVTVAVFQFAIRINRESTARALAKQNEVLAEQINRAQNDTAYFLSDDFKYDYALRYLNHGKDGDKVYT